MVMGGPGVAQEADDIPLAGAPGRLLRPGPSRVVVDTAAERRGPVQDGPRWCGGGGGYKCCSPQKGLCTCLGFELHPNTPASALAPCPLRNLRLCPQERERTVTIVLRFRVTYTSRIGRLQTMFMPRVSSDYRDSYPRKVVCPARSHTGTWVPPQGGLAP